ncbi:MAG: hypothetical protein GY739_09930 [Mesoflavibacter sp.]|nr:hypothetical protein [Mesoflavibacter sp.]
MNKRERVKLIIENWFIEKTCIKPTEEGLNNLVDRITYDKQLSIHSVSNRRELLIDFGKDLLESQGNFPNDKWITEQVDSYQSNL